jgi:hypothetical protein
MSPLLAGLVVLGLLLLLGRGYVRANPKGLVKGLRMSGGVVLALLTVLLAVRGNPLAIIAAATAWFLLFGTVPPWQRGYQPGGGTGGSPTRPGSAMSRGEAFKVLGLEDGASEDDIRSAHRRLILQTHPDKGGTNYLAAKINEAKDVLLRR